VPWWVDAIGWGGSALLVWSLMQSKVLRLRILNTVGAAVLVVYNVLIEAWPLVALNVVIIGVNVLQMWRLRGPILSATGYDLVEVDPQDDYLRHVLRVHEEDLRRFTPDLIWDPAAPGGIALLVLRGNETVGVLLLRQTAPDTVQVQLDYVTPRYRDLSPGRYVYGGSDWFASRGIRRILANEQMVHFEEYFTRMGFAWRDGRLTLDVAPVAV